jgi:CubicO group peptidase (beta-lactamase class C family)
VTGLDLVSPKTYQFGRGLSINNLILNQHTKSVRFRPQRCSFSEEGQIHPLIRFHELNSWMNWKICISVFSLFLCKPGLAQNDSLVLRLMREAKVTGICIGIVENNKAVSVKAYGYRIKEQNLFNDTSTCFSAASLSKAVFAYLVMKLVDEGKISLDTPLAKYLPKPLPEYADYADLAGDPQWKLITARHCLSHTTGFPNWRSFNPRGNKKLEIFFTPGTRYAYSGEGIDLLQMVVEVITGKGLEELAREKIFLPLAMTRTSYTWKPEFESDYAIGYNEKEKPVRFKRRTKADAAGSMETTIADYTRFMIAVNQGRGLSAYTFREMLGAQIVIHSRHQFPSLSTDTTNANDPIHLSYGLGWGLFNSSSGAAFFKEGHDDGWVHYAIGVPSPGRALVIMSNSSNGEGTFKELTERLLGITIPWEWEGYIPYNDRK